MEGKGVCAHDGALEASGSLQIGLVPTLMPTTKAMLWRLKIYWMVRTFQVVEAHEVAIHSSPRFTDKYVPAT